MQTSGGGIFGFTTVIVDDDDDGKSMHSNSDSDVLVMLQTCDCGT